MQKQVWEYYEIVDEARPLSGCFPTYLFETKQASKFQSDPSFNKNIVTLLPCRLFMPAAL